MQLTRRPLGLSRGWLLACLRQLLIEFAVALPKKLLSPKQISVDAEQMAAGA
jgi:hypothetical protein